MSSSHLFLGLPIALFVLFLELRSGHHSAAFFSHLSLGDVAILSANFHFIFWMLEMNHHELAKAKTENISVLNENIEEKMVRQKDLAVEVQRMTTELSEAERGTRADKELASKSVGDVSPLLRSGRNVKGSSRRTCDHTTRSSS